MTLIGINPSSKSQEEKRGDAVEVANEQHLWVPLLVTPPTLICFGRSASAFGSFKWSMPFSNYASALSASTPAGRLSERWKLP